MAEVFPPTYGIDPAFPIVTGNGEPQPGLSKREYFAAVIMAAITLHPDSCDCTPDEMAHDAVNHAGALIKALNKY